MLKLWERHRLLRDDADEVRHYADTMARNLSLDLLRHRRRHPFLRIFYRVSSDNEDVGSIPDVPDSHTSQQYINDKEVDDIVREAMGQLPYNWRKIVEMHEREMLSLIKYKTKRRNTIKVHLSNSFVRKYTFSIC